MTPGSLVGVDVGGKQKGFHVAEMNSSRELMGLHRLATATSFIKWLEGREPRVVAIDSPRRAAEPGERSREGERELAKNVCGIRWTPEESRLADNRYYEWILNGLDLLSGARSG